MAECALLETRDGLVNIETTPRIHENFDTIVKPSKAGVVGMAVRREWRRKIAGRKIADNTVKTS